MHIIHKSVKRNKGVPLIGWVFMLAIIATVAAWISPNNAEEKKYKTEFTLNEWTQKFSGMDTVKAVIADSDIPAVTRRYVIGILNKLQTDIAVQINPQIEADKKINEKPKADTTKKKN